MIPKHPHYETARDRQAAQAREEAAAFLRRQAQRKARLANARLIPCAA